MPALTERDLSNVEKIFNAAQVLLQYTREKHRYESIASNSTTHASSAVLSRSESLSKAAFASQPTPHGSDVWQPLPLPLCPSAVLSESLTLRSRDNSQIGASLTSPSPPSQPVQGSSAAINPLGPTGVPTGTTERRLWAELAFVFWRIAGLSKLTLLSYVTSDPRGTLTEIATSLLDYLQESFHSFSKESRLEEMAKIGRDHVLYMLKKLCSRKMCVLMLGGDSAEGRRLHDAICTHITRRHHTTWMSLVYVAFCDECAYRDAHHLYMPSSHVSTCTDVLRCLFHACEDNEACSNEMLYAEPIACVTYMFYGVKLRIQKGALLRPHEADDSTLQSEGGARRPVSLLQCLPRRRTTVPPTVSHNFQLVDKFNAKRTPKALQEALAFTSAYAANTAVAAASPSTGQAPAPSDPEAAASHAMDSAAQPSLQGGTSWGMNLPNLSRTQLGCMMVAGRQNCCDEINHLAFDVIVEVVRAKDAYQHWVILSNIAGLFSLCTKSIVDAAPPSAPPSMVRQRAAGCTAASSPHDDPLSSSPSSGAAATTATSRSTISLDSPREREGSQETGAKAMYASLAKLSLTQTTKQVAMYENLLDTMQLILALLRGLSAEKRKGAAEAAPSLTGAEPAGTVDGRVPAPAQAGATAPSPSPSGSKVNAVVRESLEAMNSLQQRREVFLQDLLKLECVNHLPYITHAAPLLIKADRSLLALIEDFCTLDRYDDEARRSALAAERAAMASASADPYGGGGFNRTRSITRSPSPGHLLNSGGVKPTFSIAGSTPIQGGNHSGFSGGYSLASPARGGRTGVGNFSMASMRHVQPTVSFATSFSIASPELGKRNGDKRSPLHGGETSGGLRVRGDTAHPPPHAAAKENFAKTFLKSFFGNKKNLITDTHSESVSEEDEFASMAYNRTAVRDSDAEDDNDGLVNSVTRVLAEESSTRWCEVPSYVALVRENLAVLNTTFIDSSLDIEVRMAAGLLLPVVCMRDGVTFDVMEGRVALRNILCVLQDQVKQHVTDKGTSVSEEAAAEAAATAAEAAAAEQAAVEEPELSSAEPSSMLSDLASPMAATTSVIRSNPLRGRLCNSDFLGFVNRALFTLEQAYKVIGVPPLSTGVIALTELPLYFFSADGVSEPSVSLERYFTRVVSLWATGVVVTECDEDMDARSMEVFLGILQRAVQRGSLPKDSLCGNTSASGALGGIAATTLGAGASLSSPGFRPGGGYSKEESSPFTPGLAASRAAMQSPPRGGSGGSSDNKDAQFGGVLAENLLQPLDRNSSLFGNGSIYFFSALGGGGDPSSGPWSPSLLSDGASISEHARTLEALSRVCVTVLHRQTAALSRDALSLFFSLFFSHDSSMARLGRECVLATFDMRESYALYAKIIEDGASDPQFGSLVELLTNYLSSDALNADRRHERRVWLYEKGCVTAVIQLTVKCLVASQRFAAMFVKLVPQLFFLLSAFEPSQHTSPQLSETDFIEAVSSAIEKLEGAEYLIIVAQAVLDAATCNYSVDRTTAAQYNTVAVGNFRLSEANCAAVKSIFLDLIPSLAQHAASWDTDLRDNLIEVFGRVVEFTGNMHSDRLIQFALQNNLSDLLPHMELPHEVLQSLPFTGSYRDLKGFWMPVLVNAPTRSEIRFSTTGGVKLSLGTWPERGLTLSFHIKFETVHATLPLLELRSQETLQSAEFPALLSVTGGDSVQLQYNGQRAIINDNHGAQAFQAGAWIHVCVVLCTNDTMRVLINGFPVGCCPMPYFPPSSEAVLLVGLGDRSITDIRFSVGEMTMWCAELSAAQVQAHLAEVDPLPHSPKILKREIARHLTGSTATLPVDDRVARFAPHANDSEILINLVRRDPPLPLVAKVVGRFAAPPRSWVDFHLLWATRGGVLRMIGWLDDVESSTELEVVVRLIAETTRRVTLLTTVDARMYLLLVLMLKRRARLITATAGDHLLHMGVTPMDINEEQHSVVINRQLFEYVLSDAALFTSMPLRASLNLLGQMADIFTPSVCRYAKRNAKFIIAHRFVDRLLNTLVPVAVMMPLSLRTAVVNVAKQVLIACEMEDSVISIFTSLSAMLTPVEETVTSVLNPAISVVLPSLYHTRVKLLPLRTAENLVVLLLRSLLECSTLCHSIFLSSFPRAINLSWYVTCVGRFSDPVSVVYATWLLFDSMQYSTTLKEEVVANQSSILEALLPHSVHADLILVLLAFALGATQQINLLSTRLSIHRQLDGALYSFTPEPSAVVAPIFVKLFILHLNSVVTSSPRRRQNLELFNQSLLLRQQCLSYRVRQYFSLARVCTRIMLLINLRRYRTCVRRHVHVAQQLSSRRTTARLNPNASGSGAGWTANASFASGGPLTPHRAGALYRSSGGPTVGDASGLESWSPPMGMSFALRNDSMPGNFAHTTRYAGQRMMTQEFAGGSASSAHLSGPTTPRSPRGRNGSNVYTASEDVVPLQDGDDLQTLAHSKQALSVSFAVASSTLDSFTAAEGGASGLCARIRDGDAQRVRSSKYRRAFAALRVCVLLWIPTVVSRYDWIFKPQQRFSEADLQQRHSTTVFAVQAFRKFASQTSLFYTFVASPIQTFSLSTLVSYVSKAQMGVSSSDWEHFLTSINPPPGREGSPSGHPTAATGPAAAFGTSTSASANALMAERIVFSPMDLQQRSSGVSSARVTTSSVDSTPMTSATPTFPSHPTGVLVQDAAALANPQEEELRSPLGTTPLAPQPCSPYPSSTPASHFREADRVASSAEEIPFETRADEESLDSQVNRATPLPRQSSTTSSGTGYSDAVMRDDGSGRAKRVATVTGSANSGAAAGGGSTTDRARAVLEAYSRLSEGDPHLAEMSPQLTEDEPPDVQATAIPASRSTSLGHRAVTPNSSTSSPAHSYTTRVCSPALVAPKMHADGVETATLRSVMTPPLPPRVYPSSAEVKPLRLQPDTHSPADQQQPQLLPLPVSEEAVSVSPDESLNVNSNSQTVAPQRVSRGGEHGRTASNGARSGSGDEEGGDKASSSSSSVSGDEEEQEETDAVECNANEENMEVTAPAQSDAATARSGSVGTSVNAPTSTVDHTPDMATSPPSTNAGSTAGGLSFLSGTGTNGVGVPANLVSLLDPSIVYIESISKIMATAGEMVRSEAVGVLASLITTALQVLPLPHWVGGQSYGSCGGLLFQMLLATSATSPNEENAAKLIKYFLFRVTQTVKNIQGSYPEIQFGAPLSGADANTNRTSNSDASSPYSPSGSSQAAVFATQPLQLGRPSSPGPGSPRQISGGPSFQSSYYAGPTTVSDIFYFNVSHFTELVVDMISINVLDLPTANSYFLSLLVLCQNWPSRYIDQLNAQVLRSCVAVLNRPSTQEATVPLIEAIYTLSTLVVRPGFIVKGSIESLFRVLYRVYTSLPPVWMSAEDAQRRKTLIALIFRHITRTYQKTKELQRALQVRALTQRFSLYNDFVRVLLVDDDEEASRGFEKYCEENAASVETLMGGRPKQKADMALKTNIHIRGEYIKRIKQFNAAYVTVSTIKDGYHALDFRAHFFSKFSSYTSHPPVVEASQLHWLSANNCFMKERKVSLDNGEVVPLAALTDLTYHYFDSQRNYGTVTVLPKHSAEADNADVMCATLCEEQVNHIAALVPPFSLRCRPFFSDSAPSFVDPKIQLSPSALTLVRLLLGPNEVLRFISNAFRINGIHATPCLVLLTTETLKLISFSRVTQEGDIILSDLGLKENGMEDTTTHSATNSSGQLSKSSSGSALDDAAGGGKSKKHGTFISNMTKQLRQLLVDSGKEKLKRQLVRDGTRVAQSVRQSTGRTYFQLFWKYMVRSIRNVRSVHYMHQDTAVILLMHHDDGPMLSFVDANQSMNSVARAQFLSVLREILGSASCEFEDDVQRPAALRTMLVRWATGSVSNYEYLLFLNRVAGRTTKDFNQYPVFPWILRDYTSATLDLENSAIFRDLAYPMGAQNDARRKTVAQFYENTIEMWMASEEAEEKGAECHPFHHGTHYSTSAAVLYFMIRTEPFTSFAKIFQGGDFDVATRLFDSVGASYSSCVLGPADCKELLPEFYFNNKFMLNADHVNFGIKADGEAVDDVKLPPWAKGSTQVFTAVMRYALESDFAINHIHQWIDLIFGVCRRGPLAAEHLNVFQRMTYGEEVAKAIQSAETPHDMDVIIAEVDNFGQTPSQLFQERHPSRSELEPIRAHSTAAGSSSSNSAFLTLNAAVASVTGGTAGGGGAGTGGGMGSIPGGTQASLANSSAVSGVTGQTYTQAFNKESPKVMRMLIHSLDSPQECFRLSEVSAQQLTPLTSVATNLLEYFRGFDPAVTGFVTLRPGAIPCISSSVSNVPASALLSNTSASFASPLTSPGTSTQSLWAARARTVCSYRRMVAVEDEDYCVCWHEREGHLMRFSLSTGQYLSTLPFQDPSDSGETITVCSVAARESLVLVAVSCGTIYCLYPDTDDRVPLLNATLCYHTHPVLGFAVDSRFGRVISYTGHKDDMPAVWRAQRFHSTLLYSLDLRALLPCLDRQRAHLKWGKGPGAAAAPTGQGPTSPPTTSSADTDLTVVSACIEPSTAYSIIVTKRSLFVFDNNGEPFGAGSLPPLNPDAAAANGVASGLSGGSAAERPPPVPAALPVLEDDDGELGVIVERRYPVTANLTTVVAYHTSEWAAGMQLFVTGHQDGSLSLWRATRLPPDTVQPGRIAVVEFHGIVFSAAAAAAASSAADDGSGPADTSTAKLGAVTALRQEKVDVPQFLVGFESGATRMLTFDESVLFSDNEAKKK